MILGNKHKFILKHIIFRKYINSFKKVKSWETNNIDCKLQRANYIRSRVKNTIRWIFKLCFHLIWPLTAIKFKLHWWEKSFMGKMWKVNMSCQRLIFRVGKYRKIMIIICLTGMLYIISKHLIRLGIFFVLHVI